MMPDKIQEKIQEKLKIRNISYEAELDEEGNYQIQTRKKVKLLGFIPLKEKVEMRINSETGETTRIKNSWWNFLAKDITEQPLFGASCGTVTPGQNDACCQTKGYDYWNSEKGECLFY
jgi:hypothetical protein